jgi:hypothetical protein
MLAGGIACGRTTKEAALSMAQDLYVGGQPLSAEGFFQLLTDEIFRDGEPEPEGKQLLAASMNFLELEQARANAIIAISREKYELGTLGAPLPFDGTRIFDRVIRMAWSDGQLDAREVEMVDALQHALQIGEDTRAALEKRARDSGQRKTTRLPALSARATAKMSVATDRSTGKTPVAPDRSTRTTPVLGRTSGKTPAIGDPGAPGARPNPRVTGSNRAPLAGRPTGTTPMFTAPKGPSNVHCKVRASAFPPSYIMDLLCAVGGSCWMVALTPLQRSISGGVSTNSQVNTIVALGTLLLAFIPSILLYKALYRLYGVVRHGSGPAFNAASTGLKVPGALVGKRGEVSIAATSIASVTLTRHRWKPGGNQGSGGGAYQAGLSHASLLKGGPKVDENGWCTQQVLRITGNGFDALELKDGDLDTNLTNVSNALASNPAIRVAIDQADVPPYQQKMPGPYLLVILLCAWLFWH